MSEENKNINGCVATRTGLVEMHTDSGIVRITNGFEKSLSLRSVDQQEGFRKAKEKLKQLLESNKEQAAKLV